MSWIFLNVLFGLILGTVWGSFCGLVRGKLWLAGGDPGTQLLRNAVGGIAGYLIAWLILGQAASEAFNYLGLFVAIIPMVILENFIKNRLLRR